MAKTCALTQADLCGACVIAFHLVAEVTGFSQTVNAENTLPHSGSQAWRNAHPHESLNLKKQRVCVGENNTCVDNYGEVETGGQRHTFESYFTWLLQIKLAPFQ